METAIQRTATREVQKRMTGTEIQRLETPGTLRADGELRLSQRIEACEWGSGSSVIRGSSFSPQLRLALAAFCYTTRADPQTHVDILGGKPYLNSSYWAEKVASHSYHYNLEQINITDGKEEEYRRLATGAADRGDRKLALKWGALADQVAALRIQFSPPKGAIAAYATIIRRFIPSAPLEKIEAGEVEDIDQYIVEVQEANWVGGNRKRDPVGMAEPEKTARTRSLRRAARMAYSAYVEQFERFREQATDRLQEEWHEVSEPIQAEVIVEDPEFDIMSFRKRFFATMRGAGIEEGNRKKWAADRGFPPSTSDWTEADFERAQEELIAPLKKELAGLYRGMTPAAREEHCLNTIGRSAPDFASHYQDLIQDLKSRGEEL